MRISKFFIISCVAFCLWGSIPNQALGSTEQDEYVYSFIKSLPSSCKPLVSYKNGQLTIKNTPWSPLAYSISCAIAASGGVLALSGFIVKNKDTKALMIMFGALAAIIGGISANSKTDPGNYILTFNDMGLWLNGRQFVAWTTVDAMNIETITICGQYGITSEEKKLKFFDRFQNQLFSISNNKPIGIAFGNLVALVKHYHQKATEKIVIPIENQTTIQQQPAPTIYMPTYNYN